MRSPPVAVFLAPAALALFVLAHSALVTPPDIITTLLHAFVEGIGGAVGYVVGALVGLALAAQRGRPSAVWIGLGVLSVGFALLFGWFEQSLGEASFSGAMTSPPSPDKPNPFLWLGLAAWCAMPLGVWLGAFAAVYGDRRDPEPN